MNALRWVAAAGFGTVGLLIVVSAMVAGSSKQGIKNPVTIWIPQFDLNGLTSGLVLLCTGVILCFLHKKKES